MLLLLVYGGFAGITDGVGKHGSPASARPSSEVTLKGSCRGSRVQRFCSRNLGWTRLDSRGRLGTVPC